MASDPSEERVLLIHVSRTDGGFRARVTHGTVVDHESAVERFASEEAVVEFVRDWLSPSAGQEPAQPPPAPEVS